MPQEITGRNGGIGRQKLGEAAAGEFLAVKTDQVGKSMIAVFENIVFVGDVQTDRQVVEKIMKRAAFKTVNFLHIAVGGDILNVPK